jgi:hypothetical protein
MSGHGVYIGLKMKGTVSILPKYREFAAHFSSYCNSSSTTLSVSWSTVEQKDAERPPDA